MSNFLAAGRELVDTGFDKSTTLLTGLADALLERRWTGPRRGVTGPACGEFLCA